VWFCIAKRGLEQRTELRKNGKQMLVVFSWLGIVVVFQKYNFDTDD